MAPERPQPVPTEAVPPADTFKLTDKDKRFLDDLAKQGVTPSTPDIALSIGAYVCQGTAAGASDQDLMTFVNAMPGSDPSFDPAKIPRWRRPGRSTSRPLAPRTASEFACPFDLPPVRRRDVWS